MFGSCKKMAPCAIFFSWFFYGAVFCTYLFYGAVFLDEILLKINKNMLNGYNSIRNSINEQATGFYG
jgi:hypothetical protein